MAAPRRVISLSSIKKTSMSGGSSAPPSEVAEDDEAPVAPAAAPRKVVRTGGAISVMHAALAAAQKQPAGKSATLSTKAAAVPSPSPAPAPAASPAAAQPIKRMISTKAAAPVAKAPVKKMTLADKLKEAKLKKQVTTKKLIAHVTPEVMDDGEGEDAEGEEGDEEAEEEEFEVTTATPVDRLLNSIQVEVGDLSNGTGFHFAHEEEYEEGADDDFAQDDEDNTGLVNKAYLTRVMDANKFHNKVLVPKLLQGADALAPRKAAKKDVAPSPTAALDTINARIKFRTANANGKAAQPSTAAAQPAKSAAKPRAKMVPINPNQQEGIKMMSVIAAQYGIEYILVNCQEDENAPDVDEAVVAPIRRAVVGAPKVPKARGRAAGETFGVEVAVPAVQSSTDEDGPLGLGRPPDPKKLTPTLRQAITLGRKRRLEQINKGIDPLEAHDTIAEEEPPPPKRRKVSLAGSQSTLFKRALARVS